MVYHKQTKSPIHAEPIHSIIAEFTENHVLPFMNSILTNPNITELEGTILTILHWIGEAQNEFDIDVAFVKYWTVIESAFTGRSANIQHTLASCTSTVIRFSGYVLEEAIDAKHIHRRVIKLYDKRSNIIHRGMRGYITYCDLGEICKYSAWVVLSLIDLSMKGYSTIEQIKPEIDRLCRLINDKPLYP